MAQQTLQMAVLYWQGLSVTIDIQYNDVNNKITGVLVNNPTSRNVHVKTSDTNGSIDLVFPPGETTVKGIGNRSLVERPHPAGGTHLVLPDDVAIATEISEYR